MVTEGRSCDVSDAIAHSRALVQVFDGSAGLTKRTHKVAVAIARTSELKAASEQVSAWGQRDCRKVLSALVAAVRHPAAALAL
jgi:hypothetical protein